MIFRLFECKTQESLIFSVRSLTIFTIIRSNFSIGVMKYFLINLLTVSIMAKQTAVNNRDKEIMYRKNPSVITGTSYHLKFPLLNAYALKTIVTVATSMNSKSSKNSITALEPKMRLLIFRTS